MAFEWISGANNKEQNRAANNVEGAKKKWNEFEQDYLSGMYDPGQMLISDNPLDTDPNKLHRYEEGPKQQARTARYLDPAHAASLGLQGASAATMDGVSNWFGTDSQFNSTGPSAWDGYTSEFANLGPSSYEGMGPSSYGGLSYDAGALADMQAGGDYFQNLSSTGNDPIAEADFQRRTAAAEASRRANTDAALAQLEQRGQGNANAGLLADLSNQQSSVSDQYLAGLDANAMAASRRDMAARSGADIARMRGDAQFGADEARAGGLDAYLLAQAGGMDAHSLAQASGIDAAGANRAAGQDSFVLNRAAGQDQFEGQKAAGKDSFVQNKMQMMDDWADNRYRDYYQNQEFNAGQHTNVDNRNMDRTWGAQDANTDMWNQAATYNQVDRPTTMFNMRNAVTTGGGNARMGAANQYNSLGQQKSDRAFAIVDRGKDVVQSGAKAAFGG